MTVFTTGRAGQIDAVIGKLANRITNAIRNDVTHQDIVNCYIKPEHRDMAVQMHSLFGLQGSSDFSSLFLYKGANRLTLSVSLTFSETERHFSIPNYCSNGMIDDPDPESRDRIHRWVNKRIELGREFGLAKDVFNSITDQCVSAKAVAFLFPFVTSLVGLIEDDPSSAKFHDKLTKPGQPPLPCLQPCLRDLIPIAEASFTRAMLADKLLDGNKSTPVKLSVQSVPTVKTPWGTTQSFL